MEKNFDRQAFNVKFDTLLASVQAAERITKPALAELSRMVLVQIHFDGDIQPVNRLLDALTPVNRKVAVLFFSAFTGFLYSEKTSSFHKKDKANYEAKAKAYAKEMEDDHFNIWTWAEREVKIEAKPFTLEKVTSFIKSALKKAEKENIPHVEMIKAVLAGGLSVDDLIDTLKAMDAVDIVNMSDEVKQADDEFQADPALATN